MPLSNQQLVLLVTMALAVLGLFQTTRSIAITETDLSKKGQAQININVIDGKVEGYQYIAPVANTIRMDVEPSFSISTFDGFTSNPPGTNLCIVARTYQPQYEYIITFLLSISHNKKTRPHVFMLRTEESSSKSDLLRIVKQANTIIGYQIASVLDIGANEARLINPDFEHDYGYAYTDASINFLIENSNIKCDYDMFTNADNFYTKGFIDSYILRDMQQGMDIIGHYKSWVEFYKEVVHDDGTKKVITAEFQATKLDLGAFIVRHQLFVGDSGMRFISIQKARPDSDIHNSDGYLIEYAVQKSKKMRLHRQVLLMHQ